MTRSDPNPPASSARQVTWVTGAAHGIGAAIARGVVDEGGHVLLTDIDDGAGRRLAADLGDRARYLSVDVTDESQVAAAAEAAEAWGELDRVFANAGVVGVTGRIEEHALADWRRTQDLLLTSVFLTLKHAIRVMRPRGRGAVVVTGSVASLRGGLGPHGYTAAKQGVKGLVESVAVEVAGDGLRVNAVAPGGTVSSLSAGLMGDPEDLETPYRRLAAASSSGVPTTSEDIAQAALFLAGPGAARINGVTLAVDGADDLLGRSGRQYYS